MGTSFQQNLIVDICKCQKSASKHLVDARKKIGGLGNLRTKIFHIKENYIDTDPSTLFFEQFL